MFHEGGTGKEKGMQRRSRTTKLRVEYSSTVSSRTICVPLVVTSTVSLHVYMKNEKEEDKNFENKIWDRDQEKTDFYPSHKWSLDQSQEYLYVVRNSFSWFFWRVPVPLENKSSS